MIGLFTAVLNLIAEALSGRKSDEDVARGLIDAAFASGVPSSILAQHLTAKAAEDVELAADLAQWLKVHGPRP